jgi:hypothetical protein
MNKRGTQPFVAAALAATTLVGFATIGSPAYAASRSAKAGQATSATTGHALAQAYLAALHHDGGAFRAVEAKLAALPPDATVAQVDAAVGQLGPVLAQLGTLEAEGKAAQKSGPGPQATTLQALGAPKIVNDPGCEPTRSYAVPKVMAVSRAPLIGYVRYYSGFQLAAYCGWKNYTWAIPAGYTQFTAEVGQQYSPTGGSPGIAIGVVGGQYGSIKFRSTTSDNKLVYTAPVPASGLARIWISLGRARHLTIQTIASSGSFAEIVDVVHDVLSK